MQNNLRNEDRILEDQLAEFVDQILADGETENIQFSSSSELKALEQVALRLKQTTIESRNPDLASLERLRKNVMSAWSANKTAAGTRRPDPVHEPKKDVLSPWRDFWFGLQRLRPMTLGLGFVGVLAALLGIAIILEPQFNPGLQGTAGGIAGWWPILMVAVGVLLVLGVAWLNTKRK